MLKCLHLILEYLFGISHAWWKCVFQVCGEKQRFEKLMEHFRNEDNNIDFMVSYFSTTFNKTNSVSTFFLKPFMFLCIRHTYVWICYKGREIEYYMLLLQSRLSLVICVFPLWPVIFLIHALWHCSKVQIIDNKQRVKPCIQEKEVNAWC